MTFPDRIRLVEVGPRDGLQSEGVTAPVNVRAKLIELLAAAGLERIEAGSFVSERMVPQMAGTAAVLAEIQPRVNARLSVIAPNMRGFEAALAAGAREVAVLTAASETFSRRNMNCGIEESLHRIASITMLAKSRGVPVRGYMSCILGCPYEGPVDVERVAAIAMELLRLGCYEISLGDTIGVGTPFAARKLVERVARDVPLDRLAGHFHDTYGQALANIFACLEVGLGVFDSSVAGLGGCPYAPGAAGNVATEDVVYMLQGSGFESGVELDRLLEAGAFICEFLGRPIESRVAHACGAKRARASALSSQLSATNFR